MEETPEAAAPQKAPATTTVKRSARKAKRKAHKAAMPAPKPARTIAPAGDSTMMLRAIYVVLVLLVVVTSFFVGYDIGKTRGMKGTGNEDTQEGSVMTGKLSIIEYSDFQCPFCSRAEPTVEQLRQAYGDKIEIIYKHYPLESIHPDALNAAIASECARDQGKFTEMHAKLFQNQGALAATNLKQYAADIGLDTGKFNTCLDTKATESRVRADMQEAESRGVSGTPSFWVKDELVVGALPYDTFKAKIDEKLSGKAAAPAAQPTQQAPPTPAAKVDVAEGKHVMGDAKAPIVIVEFSDYQCPYCKRFYSDTEQQLIDTYVKTGKARFSYRHFPLSFHQNAQKAAEGAECAGAQGKYWEMHEILFTKGNGDGTGMAVADLKQYAAELKLDTTKFNKCLDGGEMASIVQQDTKDGSAAGVQGTPSFFVNGKILVGAQPFSAFKTAIDAELAQ